MAKRVRIGMLTPSSNTVLEPICARIVAELADVSVHFSRFPVTEIALSDRALDQFDDAPIITAAELLGHARVDVIAWNGTSAGWLGFDRDERLCKAITAATGILATTAVLALNEIMARGGIERFAPVTPYTRDVQQRITANYAAAGYTCVAERHLDLADNFSFAEVEAAQIAAMVRDTAPVRPQGARPQGAGPQAVTTFCTNLFAAPVFAALERELGLPVHDTIAATMWKTLGLVGIDRRRVTGWGSMFQDLA